MVKRTLGLPILLATLAVGACAILPEWKPVAYQPKPTTASDPRAVAVTLIEANTRQGCVTEPKVNEVMMTVKFVCHSGMGNSVVRFDKIRAISLLKHEEWYLVRVEHSEGVPHFEWSSKVRSDMEKLADAFYTISQGNTATATDESAESL